MLKFTITVTLHTSLSKRTGKLTNYRKRTLQPWMVPEGITVWICSLKKQIHSREQGFTMTRMIAPINLVISHAILDSILFLHASSRTIERLIVSLDRLDLHISPSFLSSISGRIYHCVWVPKWSVMDAPPSASSFYERISSSFTSNTCTSHLLGNVVHLIGMANVAALPRQILLLYRLMLCNT